MRHATAILLGSFLLTCAVVHPGFAQAAPDTLQTKTDRALSRFGLPPDSSRVAALVAEGEPALIEARLWSRAGEPVLAWQALEALPEAEADAPVVTLERARIGMRFGGDLEAQTGAAEFWLACRSMDAAVKQQLWLDLLPLMTPEEREVFGPTDAGPAACDLVRGMFEERAHLMAVPIDERLILHFERLDHAERRFSIDAPRYYTGISDLYGRPEGLWLDVRGMLFVRMGPPDVAEACPFWPVDLLAACWVYDRPVGYKLFFLSTARRAGVGASADGDYRIQEGLGPWARPGQLYFHQYVVNADLPRSVKAQLVRSAGPVGLKDATDRRLDRAEGNIYGRLIQLAMIRYTSEAIEEIPDVPAVTSSAVMRWEALRFFNPSEQRWQVWVVASMKAEDLESVPKADSTTFAIGGWLASRTTEGYALDSIVSRVTVLEDLVEDAGIPVRLSTSSGPGPVPITLAVTDEMNPGHGAWVQDTVRVPSPSGLPHISDIAVAQREGGGWTRDGETFLQVTPAHITDPAGVIHIYFEAYGIRADREYEVEVRLTRTDDPDEMFGLPPDEVPFRLAFGSTMPRSRIGQHHVRLELGDTKPGPYTLGIRVRDPATEYYSLPSVTPIQVAE